MWTPQQLQKLPFFARLSEAEISLLLQYGRIEKVGASQLVHREGEVERTLLIVLSGHLRVRKQVGNGLDRTLAVLQPGQAAGFITFFSGGPASASVESIEGATLFRLDPESFTAFAQKAPAAALTLVVTLLEDAAQRIRGLNDQVTLLAKVYLEARRFDLRQKECPVFGRCLLWEDNRQQMGSASNPAPV